MTENSS
jgi:hypothetical protein